MTTTKNNTKAKTAKAAKGKSVEDSLASISKRLATTLGEIDGLQLEDPYITDARGFVLQANVSVDKYKQGHGFETTKPEQPDVGKPAAAKP